MNSLNSSQFEYSGAFACVTNGAPYQLIEGNKIHKTAIINWNYVKIGVGNIFGPNCIIGEDAQHGIMSTSGKVHIGNNNIFREFSCVNRPTTLSEATVVGDRNYFMTSSMVHHDCIIENDVTLCSNAALGGGVTVMNGANLGMNCSVHQFQVIGSYSIIGMNSCVIKKSRVLPGRKHAGTPVKEIGINSIGLKRLNITTEKLKSEEQRFRSLIKRN